MKKKRLAQEDLRLTQESERIALEERKIRLQEEKHAYEVHCRENEKEQLLQHLQKMFEAQEKRLITLIENKGPA